MTESALTERRIDPAVDLESASAEDRICWAIETHGDGLVMTTSFGVHSAVMLHLATRLASAIPVIFIDTGYLFPESYLFARDLTERLGLNLRKFIPTMTAAEQEALNGRLWEKGVDELKRYNFINKVEPMDRAIRETGATAWLAGLRREQSNSRGSLPVVQRQNKVTKIHPIIDWDLRRIHRYMVDHDLPYHPLWDQGYVSVGDWHSTSKLLDGMTEEQTRFNGLKRECGLHESSGRLDFQI